MRYHVVSFLGAFLLFALQPMVGRAMLPLFGGGVGVWLACMLFFQVMLLVGYTYAHKLVSRCSPERQSRIHRGLLGLAVVSMGVGLVTSGAPFLPSASLPGAQLAFLPLGVTLVLTSAVALPLVVLASTSPLAQAWLARETSDHRPYRLYVTSNAGSVAGLLTYPLLFEPLLPLPTMAWMAAVLFVVYVAIVFTLAKALPAVPHDAEQALRIPVPRRLVWMLLSAMGTLWLLAISSHVSENVASVPLMWMPPLLVYLMTFMLVFDGRMGFSHGWLRGAMLVAMVGFALFTALPVLVYLGTHGTPDANSRLLMWVIEHYGRVRDSWWGDVGVPLVALLTACLVLHGRLYDLRPEPKQLTTFYLDVAAGGALGGFLGSVIAPMVFTWYLELPLLVVGVLLLHLRLGLSLGGLRRLAAAGLAGGGLLVGGLIFFTPFMDKTSHWCRDFYGTVMVHRPHPNLQVMTHGKTVHGLQNLKEPLQPLSYYGETSGLGVLLRTLQKGRPTMRLGGVGLGGGSLAAYGRAGDEIEFYEISPKVIDLAGIQGSHFTTVKTSPAHVAVHQGDGRTLLDKAPFRQSFDVLLIDAFAGGSIPTHLLTREALQLYKSHLKADGFLVLHVSHTLPLYRQVAAGLVSVGMHLVRIPSPKAYGRGKDGRLFAIEQDSLYWVAAQRPELVFRPELLERSNALLSLEPACAMSHPGALDQLKAGSQAILGIRPWTDQENSLVPLLLAKLR